ncbi:hypothetical protein Tco_0074211 [Tanacetum coccineum]
MCASSDEEKAYIIRVPNRLAVGSIMYAVRCTRPDVGRLLNLVSRYQQIPGKLHWDCCKTYSKVIEEYERYVCSIWRNPDKTLMYRSVDEELRSKNYHCDACDTIEYMAGQKLHMDSSWIRKLGPSWDWYDVCVATPRFSGIRSEDIGNLVYRINEKKNQLLIKIDLRSHILLTIV